LAIGLAPEEISPSSTAHLKKALKLRYLFTAWGPSFELVGYIVLEMLTPKVGQAQRHGPFL
jgi:hypothetical protein